MRWYQLSTSANREHAGGSYDLAAVSERLSPSYSHSSSSTFLCRGASRPHGPVGSRPVARSPTGTG